MFASTQGPMMVCIGRDSQCARHELYLHSLGFDFKLVGSVDEYLRVSQDATETVVLVSETFDAMSRNSVCHWVRASARPTKVIILYDHHLGDAGGADAIARVSDLQNVVDAIHFVQLDRFTEAARA
jgi:hypothetical protein